MRVVKRGASARRCPVEIPSTATIRSLLAATAKGPLGIRNRAVVYLLWRGALRIGELLRLRAVDINMSEGTVRVLRAKSGRSRTVGLDDEALAAIAHWAEARDSRGLSPVGPFISTLDGDAVSQNAIREMLKRVARKAGVAQRIHPHQFRACWTTRASRQLPLIDVMTHLGHADLAVTTRYVRGLGGAAVDSARRLVWD